MGGPLGGRPSSLNTEPLLQPWGQLPHWGCVFKAPYALREVNKHLWQIPNLCICCVAKQLLSVWRLPTLFMSQYLILNLEFPRSTRFLPLLPFEKEKLGCLAWVGTQVWYFRFQISESRVPRDQLVVLQGPVPRTRSETVRVHSNHPPYWSTRPQPLRVPEGEKQILSLASHWRRPCFLHRITPGPFCVRSLHPSFYVVFLGLRRSQHADWSLSLRYRGYCLGRDTAAPVLSGMFYILIWAVVMWV